MKRLQSLILLCAFAGTLAHASPSYWRADIARFVHEDAIHPPPRHAVLFVGSSSIRMWTTLAKDFPGIATINRGFGGSELADSVYYADQIVIPYRPRIVVLYAGDNDVWAGKTPASILADFRAFRTKIHAALPDTKIIYLSIKESPSRIRVRKQFQETNRLIAADCATHAGCTFLDVDTPMLGPDGNPRPELYRKDQLHMNAKGYAIWTRLLAPLLKP